MQYECKYDTIYSSTATHYQLRTVAFSYILSNFKKYPSGLFRFQFFKQRFVIYHWPRLEQCLFLGVILKTKFSLFKIPFMVLEFFLFCVELLSLIFLVWVCLSYSFLLPTNLISMPEPSGLTSIVYYVQGIKCAPIHHDLGKYRGVMKRAVKWTSTDVNTSTGVDGCRLSTTQKKGRLTNQKKAGRRRPVEKGSLKKAGPCRPVEKGRLKKAGRRRLLEKGRLKKAGRLEKGRLMSTSRKRQDGQCRPVEKVRLVWLTSTTAFFMVNGRQLFSSRPNKGITIEIIW